MPCEKKRSTNYNKVLGHQFTIESKTTTPQGKLEYQRLYMRMIRGNGLSQLKKEVSRIARSR